MTVAATVLDEALRRDIAILSALAQFHCATTPQLHALCFPFQTVATARNTLHHLAEAHFIVQSNWRLTGQNRSGVWVLMARGHELLQRYVAQVPPLARLDLGRPSTALEREEWRVRLHIRTLLTRLLLEARQTPVFQSITVELPWNVSWPTAWGQTPLPDPDACIRIAWQPAERKAADWLPWLEPTQAQIPTMCYPVYLERTHAQISVLDLLPAWVERRPDNPHIPLVIVQDDAHYARAVQQFQRVPTAPVVRIASWSAFDVGVVQASMQDERGRPCRLAPILEGVVA